MTRGFVIMAQNTEKTDYVSCAKTLEHSIKRVMPDSNVTIITTEMLPHGDLAPDSDWKLINDYQVYEASPYDETIKLEADMYLPRSIEHWWDILSVNDVVVSTTIRNYKGEISDSKEYRNFITDNHLPDVYNAITYFKKSQFGETFFNTVKDIFMNWEEYKKILVCNTDLEVTTDWAYSLACHILSTEKTTLPGFSELSMVHMKQFVNNIPSEDWTESLIYEILPEQLRIQTFPQMYPFHYHVKTFSDKILEGTKWNK